MARPFTIAAVLFFGAWVFLAWTFHPDNLPKKERIPPALRQEDKKSDPRSAASPATPVTAAPAPAPPVTSAPAPPAPAPVKCDVFGSFGMTWGRRTHLDAYNADLVGCTASPPVPQGGEKCNPLGGDTPCSQSLPILCIKKSQIKKPQGIDGEKREPLCSHPSDCGWSGGEFKLTPSLQGCSMKSAAAADELCVTHAGPGYQMAAFHDGRQDAGHGWGMFGQGNIFPDKAPNTRFWVKIGDQNGNCWDPRRSG